MNWNTELYNNQHAFVYQYGEAVIDLLDPRSFENILDLGCGTGELTQKIKEKGCLVLGIDSSAEMIAKAKAAYPLIPFEVADATAMEYDNEFDAVFSNAVLHWINDQEKAAENIYKALRTNGRLVAEFGGQNCVKNIIRALRKSFEKRGLSFEECWFFPSPGQYATILEEKGFRVNMIQHFDRQTELADDESGMKDWIEMFGNNFFNNILPEQKKQIIEDAVNTLRPTNYKNGKWFADYTRLRVKAIKE
jgi:trans-aconitate methyltransferase